MNFPTLYHLYQYSLSCQSFQLVPKPLLVLSVRKREQDIRLLRIWEDGLHNFLWHNHLLVPIYISFKTQFRDGSDYKADTQLVCMILLLSLITLFSHNLIVWHHNYRFPAQTIGICWLCTVFRIDQQFFLMQEERCLTFRCRCRYSLLSLALTLMVGNYWHQGYKFLCQWLQHRYHVSTWRHCTLFYERIFEEYCLAKLLLMVSRYHISLRHCGLPY